MHLFIWNSSFRQNVEFIQQEKSWLVTSYYVWNQYWSCRFKSYMPCSLVLSWKVGLYRLEYSFSQMTLSGFAEIFMWKVVDGKISYNQLSRTSSGRITRFYTLRTRPSTVQSFSNPQILHPMFTFNQLRSG